MATKWNQTDVAKGTFGFNVSGYSVPLPTAAAVLLTCAWLSPTTQAGQPNPALIPLEEIQAALARVAAPPSGNPLMLQYRTPKEFLDCRRSVATLLSEAHGVPVSAEDIAITSGNSAALGMLFSNVRIRRRARQGVATAAAEPPTAIVEHPTYFLARDMLLDAGVIGRGCEVDSQGIRVDQLRQMCEADGPPDFVYLNPNFHNPTGCVLSQERRRALVSLAVEFDFLVLSDEPYNLLHFDATMTPPLPLALEPGASKHVLSLGSFSKILAPGLRIGMSTARCAHSYSFSHTNLTRLFCLRLDPRRQRPIAASILVVWRDSLRGCVKPRWSKSTRRRARQLPAAGLAYHRADLVCRSASLSSTGVHFSVP